MTEVILSKWERESLWSVWLINGLPLINIEQKWTDKALDEAVGQFNPTFEMENLSIISFHFLKWWLLCLR